MREIIDGTLLYQWIILAFFLIAFLVQLGIYLFVFLKVPLYSKKQKRAKSPGISVIICAKNEEKNLKLFLPQVLQQEYPDFEVVVVNDSSTDNTEELLMQLSAQMSKLIFSCNIPNCINI